MKKRIYFTLFLFINLMFCNAQNNIHPDNPEVSTLIHYIEEPVSYNRGRVSINIPIYTIEEDGITIPISLSYNHGGLKPNERSRWIGIGWVLNAEPSIATSGRAVEYNSALDPSINRNEIYYLTNLSKGFLTTEEPSEFYYNLPNKSGAFYLNHTLDQGYKPVTLPFEPIMINWFKTKDTKSADVFEITDEQGVFYRFGKSLLNDKYIVGDNGTSNNLYKGTEIISASKKDTISFEYYADYREDIVSINDNYQVEDDLNNYLYTNVDERPYLGKYHQLKASLPNCSDIYSPSDYHVPYISYNDNDLQKTNYFYCKNDLNDNCHITDMLQMEIEKCRTYNDVSNNFRSVATPKIQTIKFKKGKVIFSNSNTALESIIVYNNQNEIVRKIKFNNKLIGGNSQYPMLQSIEIKDKKDQVVEKYQFGYNGDPYTDYTEAVNFWGYSLNYYWKENNVQNSIVPVKFYHTNQSYNLPVKVGRIEREVQASKAGILTSITNSLGGTTNFEYESDSYGKHVIQNPIDPNPIYKDVIINAGGIRIKKITHTDLSLNSLLTREFKYGKKRKDEIYKQENTFSDPNWDNEESGLGYLKRSITVNDYMSTQTKTLFQYFPTTGILDPEGTTRLRTLSTWLTGDITYSGAPVLYDRVSEYITKTTIDQNSGLETITDNGKIEYDYQGFEYYKGSTRNGVFEDSKNDWMCGQLLSKKIFKKTDNTQDPYSLISRTDYEYQTFDKDKIAVGKAFLSNIAVVKETYTGSTTLIDRAQSAEYHRFDILTGVLKVKIQTDSIFTPQGVVVTNKQYSYDNLDHLYPTSIVTTNSDGKIRTQNLSYTLDTGTLTDPEHLIAKNDLKKNWIISPVLEEKETVESSSKTTYNSYKTFSNGLPLLNRKLLEFNNNGKNEQMLFQNYDIYGNPLSILKNNSEQLVYLWGYNSQYPIAEIKNVTYGDVETQLGGSTQIKNISDALIPDMTSINALRIKLPNAFVTTFTYNTLVGMTSMTDPRGIITRYFYDTANRLALVRDNNANILKSVKYAYQNTPAIGLDVVSYPAMSAIIQKEGISGMSIQDFGSVSVSGGSGNFTYLWCLKNSSGTVLTPASNSTSSIYYYSCPETGDITMQCVIFDNSTGKSITVTKLISCMSVTATINTNPTYSLSSTGSATLSLTYGTGNYSYTWVVVNGTTPLSGIKKGFASNYTFICSQVGNWTVQCTVIDKTTGKTIIVTKGITII